MFPILLPVGVLSQDSNLSHRKLELGKPLQKDTLAPMVSSACLVKKSIMKMLVQLAQFALPFSAFSSILYRSREVQRHTVTIVCKHGAFCGC